MTGIEREGGVQGEEDHDRGGEDHPVVVIEVETPVDQLHVAETDREETGRQAVAVSEGDAEPRQADHQEMEVHPRLGPDPHPFEAGIGEVIRRLDQERLDPTPGEEPDDEDHADDPEPDAEQGSGGGTHLFGRPRPDRGGRDHPVSPSVSEKPRVMSNSETTSDSNSVLSSAMSS